MPDLVCPECGGRMIYDPVTGYYTCTSCGLYASRAQISAIKARKAASRSQDDRSKYRDYAEWWASKKK